MSWQHHWSRQKRSVKTRSTSALETGFRLPRRALQKACNGRRGYRRSIKKAEATASKPERYLGRRVAGKPDASTFDAGAPAVPLVPSDENFLPGRPVSFNDRFGNWISSPPVSAPRGPYQPAPQASRPRGIVSGEPMPDWPFPPPFFDFPNKSAARSEDSEDWLARLLRAVGRY
jgi:hypothetical protein